MRRPKRCTRHFGLCRRRHFLLPLSLWYSSHANACNSGGQKVSLRSTSSSSLVHNIEDLRKRKTVFQLTVERHSRGETHSKSTCFAPTARLRRDDALPTKVAVIGSIERQAALEETLFPDPDPSVEKHKHFEQLLPCSPRTFLRRSACRKRSPGTLDMHRRSGRRRWLLARAVGTARATRPPRRALHTAAAASTRPFAYNKTRSALGTV